MLPVPPAPALLTLERRVSAGWEMMAAATPAMTDDGAAFTAAHVIHVQGQPLRQEAEEARWRAACCWRRRCLLRPDDSPSPAELPKLCPSSAADAIIIRGSQRTQSQEHGCSFDVMAVAADADRSRYRISSPFLPSREQKIPSQDNLARETLSPVSTRRDPRLPSLRWGPGHLCWSPAEQTGRG